MTTDVEHLSDGPLLLPSAIANPEPVVPVLPSLGTRRSSYVDMLPAALDGTGRGVLTLRGAVRDLRAEADGRTTVLAAATLDAEVANGLLTQLDTTPSLPDAACAALLGVRVGSGFRPRLRHLLPDDPQAPLRLLLDDVPVATFIAAYGVLRSSGGRVAGRETASHMRDVCSGWRSGGAAISAVERMGRAIIPLLPAAPSIRPVEPDTVPDLPPGWMRRRRRIDVVTGDESHAVEATFRDTWVDADGTEGVLHEYVVRLQLSREGQILDLRAEPRVLPFAECPSAGEAARDLMGAHIGELAGRVSQELVGVHSCTHLNDLLRSLACAGLWLPAPG